MEGNFGLELTGAIFFPRPLSGLGSISSFIFKIKKLTKPLCSQYHCVVSAFYITSGSRIMPSVHFREYILHLTVS